MRPKDDTLLSKTPLTPPCRRHSLLRPQASRLKCYVQVGYPQKVAAALSDSAAKKTAQFFNSLCLVNPEGVLVHTYQKHFLFEADETWAEEGPGFCAKEIIVQTGGGGISERKMTAGMGICMDINPYRFTAPFRAFEFANFQRNAGADVILFSTNWLSYYSGHDPNHRDDPQVDGVARNEELNADSTDKQSKEDDRIGKSDDGVSDTEACLEKVNYWALRLLPLYRDEKDIRSLPMSDSDDEPNGREGSPLTTDAQKAVRAKKNRVIVVAANRVGKERGCIFAGASCIMDLRADSHPRLLGMLGNKDDGLLVADVPDVF